MANEDNLISLADRTTEEQREIATLGGIASGEARRKKKAMKEQAELLLSLPLNDKRLKEKVESMGVDPNDVDNQMAMITSIWFKAMKGDVSAATWLRDVCGENPTNNVNVTGALPVVIKGEDELIDDDAGATSESNND